MADISPDCPPEHRGLSKLMVALPAHTWFAFLVTLLTLAIIACACFLHTPVSDEIVRAAIDAAGGMGTVVAVSYIGGSVVQASDLLSMLGQRFGRLVPAKVILTK